MKKETRTIFVGLPDANINQLQKDLIKNGYYVLWTQGENEPQRIYEGIMGDNCYVGYIL